jgi:hypothetical protein
MGVGAMMMIHPPLSLAMGNAADLRKTADVLDKVQTGLSAIYTTKTGKSLDEITKLVNDETWMTADEAVAAGFADAVGDPMGADGDEGEPDPDDPNEGNEDEPTEPARLDVNTVMWNRVKFPATALPERILAMVKPPETKPAAVPAPVLAIVPPPPPEPVLSRAEIERRAPEVVAVIKAEAQAAGVAAERARLQGIDDLGLKGCADLIAAAKYGPSPMDAPTLAVAAIKAGHQAGIEMLAARRVESRPLAGVVAGAPDQTASAEQARIVKAIADGGNARRGGK